MELPARLRRGGIGTALTGHRSLEPLQTPGNLSPPYASKERKGTAMVQPAVRKANLAAFDDAELDRLALGRDADAFATIMRRHNQRLYRIARSVLRNSAEAEDAVQDAYVAAFSHLASYRGESPLAAWLARIVMNEALGRLRRKPAASDFAALEAIPEAEIIQFPSSAVSEDPEKTMAQRQILQLVENATDALPEVYRVVFVTRVIEGMSVEETADLLRIKPETVKTRLHRARQLVRDQLN